MNRAWKRVTVTVMILGLVFTGPTVAYAAQTASSLPELAKIVNQECMKKSKKIEVNYSGPKKDLAYVTENDDFSFFFCDMALEDDPATSDDADYVTGSLDWSTKKHDFYAEGEKLVIKPVYLETLAQTAYVNEKVPEILAELDVDGMSNYEKVKTIHDYVCDLITYKAGKSVDYFSMYGAIKNRKGVCNAYSLCMYKLLVEAGVPCKYIGGVAGTGNDAEGHAWNIVALGDRWYNLDVTWDDPDDSDGRPNYNYFLKGSKDFDEYDPEEVHTMDKPYRTVKFAKLFPIATNAFNPTMMDDENKTITIGSTAEGIVDSDSEPEETKYTLKDVLEGKWPSNGKFTVKKNKRQEIFLFIEESMDKVIKNVTYKFTTGKSRVKNVHNYKLEYDEKDGLPYTTLTFKGKKKGAVTVKIILKLTNGQSLSVTFKGKVK
ncbi:MAG: hypothetical protein K5639_06490 [Eubacterium sp.]|nr:hypothetical protein [Eubacterium sp.]